MRRAAKVTISLPGDVLEAVERERESRGETRSQFLLRAVDEYFSRQRRHRDIDEYIRSYQQAPESQDREQVAWVQTTSRGLALDPWDSQPTGADEGSRSKPG